MYLRLNNFSQKKKNLIVKNIYLTINIKIKNKDKKIDEIDINEIEECLAELEKEEQKEYMIINKLNYKLFEINIILNKEILCEGCKGKKIKKLTDECGNEEIARVLYYQCK